MAHVFELKTLLVLIPALPLAGAAITAVLGRRVLGRHAHLPVVCAIILSFLAAVALVFQMEGSLAGHKTANGATATYEEIVRLWSWLSVPQAMNAAADAGQTPPGWGQLKIEIALRADPLTAAMLAIVTCISALVAVYSIGYMHGDPGYARFFSYIGLFVFSMTMLVSASNFLLLYVFWELVGLCSYLLIGFWYERPAAAAAGKKAFLVNRIGDVGFALGVFLIWTLYGTLDFHDTTVDGQLVNMGVLGATRLSNPDLFIGGGVATAVCLLLFLGACGKSAQFPLHVWLPDAMEGPTPVSALIHAATMVTAGVYMVARCMPLFAASLDAQQVVSAIGGITALLGAIIALTQTDLKRILAYSTISHLGYMFVALGTGTVLGVVGGMFHLMTHAFFKALLFLGAGSVMHAAGGVIDIRRLGGLRRLLPITYLTFLVGCLAIAGVPPLAGFWSKDTILLALWERSRGAGEAGLFDILLASTLFGVLLIDFYTFRPFFRVFHGPERLPEEAGGDAQESPPVMTVPLVLLALGAATVGAYFEWTHGFAHFLAATPSLDYLARHFPQVEHVAELSAIQWKLGSTGTILTMLGILLCSAIYFTGDERRAERVAQAMNVIGLYTLSFGKFFLDEVYLLLVVWPLWLLARLAAWLDDYVIDGLVNLCGLTTVLCGAVLRPIQNGLVQFYALLMAIGVAALLMIFLM